MWCAIITNYNYGDGNEVTGVFTSESRETVVDQVFKSVKDCFGSGDPYYKPSDYFDKYGEVMNGQKSLVGFRNFMIEIHQSTHF